MRITDLTATPAAGPPVLDLSQTTFLVLLGAIAAVMLLIFGLAGITAYLRLKNNRQAARWARLETTWNGLLLDVLAGEQPQRALLERVQRRDRLFFVDFLFRFARRFRGDDRRVLSELAERFLPEIASRAQGGDAERRARALDTLALLDFRAYEPEILAGLDDPSPLVAMVAARSLCREERVQHLDRVFATIERFDQWSGKYLSSLLAAAGPDAAPSLRRVLADRSRSPALRVVAAGALQSLHDPESADAAATLIGTEVDREVVCAALRLLAAVGHATHLEQIRPLAGSVDEVVRAQALAAVARLGAAADVESLRRGFDDPSPWVAIHAVRGLRDLGETRLLWEMSHGDSDRAALVTQVLREDES